MTILQNTAAGGTNLAAVTPANSGGASGSPFDVVLTSGGQSFTFDSTYARGGSPLSYMVSSSGTSGVAYGVWQSLNGSQWRARVYVYLTALPTAEQVFIWLSATTTVQASLGILSSGKLVQRASGTAGTGNSGTAIMPINQWVRFEFSGTVGTSGTMQSAMYSADSTTALESLSTTGQNTGTAAIANARFGNVSTNTTSSTYWLSAPAAGDDSTTFFGPQSAASNTPPSITGPSVVNTTATTASVTFSATDSGGSVSSFACVNQSNTALTSVTPTIGAGVVTGAGTSSAAVTFPISGLTANAQYRFGGTATDNNGAVSSTAVAVVNVTKDTPDIRAAVATGFTVVGGGTVLDCILAGTPTTRYLESTAPPGGASVTVTYQPATPSTLAKTFAFPVRAKDTTSTETATVRLMMNDTTQIASRGPVTLTTTSASCGGTTTTSESAAITDHSKLSIVVVTN